MTIDYTTATAQECADWLAEREGWTFKYNSWWHPTIMALFHPFPLTLDAAAKALRKPWRLDGIIVWRTSGLVNVSVYNTDTWGKVEAEGPDELTARYRAAVAAAMEDER